MLIPSIVSQEIQGGKPSGLADKIEPTDASRSPKACKQQQQEEEEEEE